MIKILGTVTFALRRKTTTTTRIIWFTAPLMIVIYLSWLEFVEHFLWARLYIKHATCIISFIPFNISELNSIIITSSMDVETEYCLDYNGQWKFHLFFYSTVLRWDHVTSSGQWILSRSEAQFFRIKPAKSPYVLLLLSPSFLELKWLRRVGVTQKLLAVWTSITLVLWVTMGTKKFSNLP